MIADRPVTRRYVPEVRRSQVRRYKCLKTCTSRKKFQDTLYVHWDLCCRLWLTVQCFRQIEECCGNGRAHKDIAYTLRKKNARPNLQAVNLHHNTRTRQAMYTRVNKNPSAWNFLSPKPEVTCGTVAIIIRDVLLSPYLRIRAVSLSTIHYNQSHRGYINRRRQYICLIWN